jgi:hypothetical protein
MNICYGEKIEMEKWISDSIAPLGVILLFFYIFLYFASDLISKPTIKLINISILILVIFCIGLGIYTLASAGSKTVDNIKSSWDILSQQSKIYYYDNDVNVLLNTYHTKMYTTGGLYVLLAIMSIILVVFSFQYYEKLTNDWRPPLRARLSDERAQRYIDMYAKFNKDYKRLSQLENYSIDKKRSENKIDNIIDGVVDVQNNLDNPNNQQANVEYQEVNKLNDEFNVDVNENNENMDGGEKKKKRTVNLRRNKKEEPQNQNN